MKEVHPPAYSSHTEFEVSRDGHQEWWYRESLGYCFDCCGYCFNFYSFLCAFSTLFVGGCITLLVWAMTRPPRPELSIWVPVGPCLPDKECIGRQFYTRTCSIENTCYDEYGSAPPLSKSEMCGINPYPNCIPNYAKMFEFSTSPQ